MEGYSKEEIHRSALNLVVLGFPIQIFLAVVTFILVNSFYYQPQLENFTISILVTCVAALIENACEPFYVLMLLRMDLQNRVKSEGLAIFVKSVSLYIFLHFNLGLLAFSLAQITYCLMLLSMYSYFFRGENIKSLF